MGVTKARRLDAVLQDREALPPGEALPLFEELLRALDALHKQGKTLGAIYPDQVLLEQGFVQIFELASQRLPEDLTLTYLAFAPPELLESQPATPQSDIYSAGVILFVLLTGRLPFDTTDREDLTSRILQSKLEPVPQIHGFSQLDWILKKCLLRAPNRRFANAQELLQELKTSLRPARGSQGLPAGVSGAVAVKKLQRKGQVYQQLLQEHWKIAAGAGAVVLVIIVALLLFSGGDEQKVDRSERQWSIRQLTASPDMEQDPALSPDGGTIVYVSNMTGNWDIYVRGLGGGDAKQITETPGRESHPRWSPDGKLILFTYESIGMEPAVFSVPPAGGIPQKLADNAKDAEWSSDGAGICYITPAAEGARTLEILDITTLNKRTVVKDIQGLGHPAFSRDGKKIVCEADSDQGRRLFVVDAKTGKMKAIKNAAGSTPFWDWSSGWIYYVARENGTSRIVRTDTDGFSQPVTSGEGQELLPVPAFSGSPVLFFRLERYTDVFRIVPDGASMPERVSPAEGESSTPRSLSARTLLFVRGREGHLQLQSAILGGSVATSVENLKPGAVFSVSPDGAFVYVQDPEENKKGLWQIPTAGGNALSLGEQLLAPYEISPDRKSLFYGRKTGDGARYLVKDLRTQEEKEVATVSGSDRIGRAAWLDNSATLLVLLPGKKLAMYNLRDAATSTLLENCHDFSRGPRSEQVAALTGASSPADSLVLLDLRSRKQEKLYSFDAEAYALSVDWARDGSAIYYDRYKPGSDLYAAE